MNRRSFIVGVAAAGGGLSLGMKIPFGPDVVRAADGSPEVNAWVVIRPDDTVVIRIARSEMGQGTLTGLAQLVAEELECDWSKVTTEFPSAGANLARKRVWGNMSTGGSRGIRNSHEYVREGGAAAREMLIQAAANEWKVPASECSAANSVITHKASGRTTTYGKVAEAAAKIEPPKGIKLKDVKDWKVAGKGVKRLDTYDKLIGKMTYGIDLKMPGMLIATIKDSPVPGGKVKSFDAAKVASMAGVKKVVPVGDSGVAVVADTYWHARKAMDALPIVWDPGENAKVSSATIADFLKDGLDAEQAFIGNKQGDAKAALAAAPRKFEAVYSYPYLNHATMEPMNATALYTADKCEVWGPTQNAEAALAATSEESGLPVAKCDMHKTFLGGGFGRRGRVDYVRQVVDIAKQMPGTPIKLIWSREEDMTHCAYHPITQCKLTAGIDADGNVTAFHMRISGQSIVASLAPERMENGMDPIVFQGLTPNSPEGNFGYQHPEHPDRPRDAQPAHAGRLLARRERQPQRDLRRVLHRRARARAQAGSARVPPQDAQAEECGGAQGGGGEGRLGHAGAGGRASRAGAVSSATGATGRLRRSVGQPRRHAQDPPHRRGDQSGHRRQSGADRAAGSGLVRVRPVRADLRRVHGEGRRDRADQLRQLPRHAHPRDAEGRDDRDAVGRRVGRGRRADHRRRGPGGAQRHLRRDRQAPA